MFDLQEFYDGAHQGKQIDSQGLYDYLRSFDQLYIWGAGNLGSALGEKLNQLGLPFSGFWDTRAEKLLSILGKPVYAPFFCTTSKNRIGIIFCITSSFVMEHCLAELKRHGFDNLIKGDYLFEGLVCEFNDQTRFLACRNATACDVYTCVKNESWHRNYLNIENKPDALYFKNVTFVINQICTLKCKYCYSYTNAYSDDRRVNFPLERILSDIDKTFDSIDGAKVVPLIGGETFLHPDLNQIIRKFLEKPNFGLLNVTTNGICKIHDRQLENLDSERIQVVFSNYKTALPSKECEIFDRNIEKVRAAGARVKVLSETPLWSVPTTLWDRDYPLEVMKEKRKTCLSPLICKYVKNGYFYPCTVADSIYNIGVTDYPQDRVALAAENNPEEIRHQIHTLLGRDYFHSCRHCDGVGGTTGVTATAGEQGYYEVVNFFPRTTIQKG